MGLLTDFFIAKKDDYRNYGGGGNFPKDDFYQAKHLTSLELAGILIALTGEEKNRVEVSREFELLTEEGAEQWTFHIPTRMVDKLIELEHSEIVNVSEKAATITAEELNWAPSDFVPVISNLKKLSEQTRATNKLLYLWMSL